MSSRLDRLLEDLAAAADGKRHLPVVRPHDAEAVVGLFHAQLDAGTAARSRAALSAGRPIACGPGCDACCRNIPAVHAGEAVTIARWLLRPEQDAIRDAFLARFEAWRAGLGDLVDAWIAASAAGDRDAGVRIGIAAFRRGVPCAFLDAGRCSIYAVRPAVCREHHAVITPEHCQPDAGEVEQARFPPLDDYVAKIQPILLALHDALHPDAPGAAPVCQAVYDELAALVTP